MLLAQQKNSMDKSTIHTVVIVLAIFGALLVSNGNYNSLRTEMAVIRAEVAGMRGALNAHILGHQHGIADASGSTKA